MTSSTNGKQRRKSGGAGGSRTADAIEEAQVVGPMTQQKPRNP
jgi:hypothetical protein